MPSDRPGRAQPLPRLALPHPLLHRRPDRLSALSWLAAAAALLAAAIAYRAAYAGHFAVLHDPAFPQWWEWADQGRYYRAARAWAHLDLDPAQHWYFAGYPLLGALFYPLDPGHPFYWPDLLCLLATGALLTRLGERLVDPPPLGRLLGALAFTLAIVLPPLAMKSFVEPWTTTPTAPITLASFLCAVDLWTRPTPRRAALLGFLTAAVALFRPVDLAPLGLATAATSLTTLRRPRLALAALAGAAIPLALTTATYLAVFGWHRSPYLQQSAQTGFEWRLIPLRWVEIVVSAMPEYPEEYSLAQTFPWIVPGIAGLAAALLATHGQARRRHALIAAATILHILLYLAYRDMHLQGLFRFSNYHYFKWCLPILALYAAILLRLLCRRRVLPVAAGLAASLFLFSWRMTWRERPAPWLAQAERPSPHTLVLPRPPASVDDGLAIPAEGGLAPIYLLGAEMRVGDRLYHPNTDTKAIPRYGDLVFTVLRPIPPGPTTITFNGQVWLTPGPLHLLHAHLFFRWPHPLGVVWTYANRWLTGAPLGGG